jgi:dihydroorotate dehydrogenase (NAD+) catalytic subunit
MKIDIKKRAFALANRTGGLSGPAIKPIAVRMVYQVCHAVDVPVIGMGGITTWEDAIEFIMAGATMVSVGTANFHDPYATLKIIEGIEGFMAKEGIHSLDEIRKCL